MAIFAVNIAVDQQIGQTYRTSIASYSPPTADTSGADAAVEDTDAVDAAVSDALDNAAPDFDSTADIGAINTAFGDYVSAVEAAVAGIGLGGSGGALSIVFDDAVVTDYNALKAAVDAAMAGLKASGRFGRP